MNKSIACLALLLVLSHTVTVRAMEPDKDSTQSLLRPQQPSLSALQQSLRYIKENAKPLTQSLILILAAIGCAASSYFVGYNMGTGIADQHFDFKSLHPCTNGTTS